MSTNPKTAPAPTLLLVGHARGDVGEVHYARKTIDICEQQGIPALLLDLFDFFPPGTTRRQYEELAFESSRWSRDHAGLITDPDIHPLTAHSSRLVGELKRRHPLGVVLLVTWPWSQLTAARMGFSQRFATVGSYYSHTGECARDYRCLLLGYDLLSCHTTTAAVAARDAGVPGERIVLTQAPYPSIIDEIRARPAEETRRGREEYVLSILRRMGRPARLPPSFTLIGSISRLIRHYRPGFILQSLAPLLRERKDTFLLFKGENPPIEGRDDQYFAAMEAMRDEPWFLFDDSRSPAPDIYHVYSYLDVAIFAGSVANAATEMAGLGVPLILPGEPNNTGLFKEAGLYFRWDEPSSLSDTVARFLELGAHPRALARRRIRELGERSLSPAVLGRRMRALMEAAVAYRYEEDAAGREQMKRRVSAQLERDLG